MVRRLPRPAHELRRVRVMRRYTRSAPGSVLYQAGRTRVLCTASVSDRLPEWMEGRDRGWITAEYSMLPGSTNPRKPRDRGGRVDGRTTEIQRLIGRSLRAVADLDALGPRLITVDCDVVEADGGTRTASITGGLMAVVDALHHAGPSSDRYPLRDSVAAISVGVVADDVVLDLDYAQDAAASVDMNVVMTGSGRFVEIQGTGEEATFTDRQLQELLKLAKSGLKQLRSIQREALGKQWPFA